MSRGRSRGGRWPWRARAVRRRLHAGRPASSTSTPRSPTAAARRRTWSPRPRRPASASWSSPTTTTSTPSRSRAIATACSCIVGTELSTTAGHLLGLGIPDPVFRFSGDATDALDDVRDLGGVAFAAHPTSARADFRWTGWDLPGPWGIELLNGDSQWRAAGWPRLLRTAAAVPAEPALRAAGQPDRRRGRRSRAGTRCWPARGCAGDRRRRRPPARGADAQGSRCPSRRTRPSSALARNHVLLDRPLTGDAAADAPRGRRGARPRPQLRRARRARARGRVLVRGRGRRRGARRWGRRSRRSPACGSARAAGCPRARALRHPEGRPAARRSARRRARRRRRRARRLPRRGPRPRLGRALGPHQRRSRSLDARDGRPAPAGRGLAGGRAGSRAGRGARHLRRRHGVRAPTATAPRSPKSPRSIPRAERTAAAPRSCDFALAAPTPRTPTSSARSWTAGTAT